MKVFPSIFEFSSTCRKELKSLKENIELLQLSDTHKVIYQRLHRDFDKTQAVLEEIYSSMEYFGYAQTRTAPVEFFSFWVDFTATFKISLKWLEDNKLIEAQRRRRNAQRMRDNLIQSLVGKENFPDESSMSELKDLADIDAASFRNGIMDLVESSDLHINLRKCAENNSRVSIKRRKRKRNYKAYQTYNKIDIESLDVSASSEGL